MSMIPYPTNFNFSDTKTGLHEFKFIPSINAINKITLKVETMDEHSIKNTEIILIANPCKMPRQERLDAVSSLVN